jgi:hypothetical protein
MSGQNKISVDSRTALNLALPILIGVLIGLFALGELSKKLENFKNFEELALGDKTSSYYAQVDGHPVHCHDYDDSLQCIDSYKRTSKNEVVLWLGNSQVHAINQMKSGDETAAPILHRSLRNYQKYFMTFSQGNASLQEHYVLFEYLSAQLPVSTLVLPVVFDDMRETGIRSTINNALKEVSVVEKLEKTEIGSSLLASQGEQDMAGNDMAALEDTVQEKSENFLNSKLVSIWKIWGDRPSLRGEILYSLYVFRNWLFGITPSSIRKMIPGRYVLNRQALSATLKSANKQGIQVLLYIVPLRNDVKIPYEMAQYMVFKQEIKTISEEFNARFINIENLVPANLWGSKASTSAGEEQELDFMHFQAGGHKLLANVLKKELLFLWGGEN